MLRPEIFQFFSNYIAQATGIQYSEANQYQLEGRLQDIARYGNLSGVEELFQVAQSSALRSDLKQLLLDISTNNETSFFRDKKPFEAFKDVILPDFFSRVPMKKMRIWSAASSFGQEALSLSMLIEEFKLEGFDIPVEIVATDISEAALSKAKSGEYTQLEVQRGLPIKLLTKYFEPCDNGWRVKSKIHQRVRYAHQNLLERFTLGGQMDVIFCRNVLIYQSIVNKKAIVSRLFETLNEGGYLIMGAGESLIGINDSFHLENKNGVICYRKTSKKTMAA